MYLKNTEEWQVIPADLKQTWQNKFTSNVSKNEVIKMKNENILTDRDLDIAKFLFKFRFATLNQIFKFLNGSSSINSVKSRLDKLVQYRILNKFMLGIVEEDKISQDALVIYCLDLGGRYLVEHYSNEDATDWYVITNMKASEIISKDLLTTEFYLRVIATVGKELVYFNPNPELRVGKKNVIPNFEMCIAIGGIKKYFIGEVVRDFDIPLGFRQKAEKLEQLLTTNAWKKYYYESDMPPVLFVFCENDMIANESGKIISESTAIEGFRLSSDYRIERPLYEMGAFLKYLPDFQKVKEVKASATFKPE